MNIFCTVKHKVDSPLKKKKREKKGKKILNFSHLSTITGDDDSDDMMPNDHIERVRQRQMVVVLIRLKEIEKPSRTKSNLQLTLQKQVNVPVEILVTMNMIIRAMAKT